MITKPNIKTSVIQNRLFLYNKVFYIPFMIILSLSLATVYLFHIPKLYQLYVLHDEFGYWANAAFFSGYDWSGAASLSPYYSYGYSILLVPFMLIFRNSVYMYRAAIVLNCAFYVGAFYISVLCAGKLWPKRNRYVNAFLCFVVSLYCNNLLQVNISWGEALLYFLYWLSFYTLVTYCQKRRPIILVAFIAECFYMYIVHQRTIGLIIAGFMVLAVMFISDRHIKLKKIIIMVSATAAILAACIIAKEIVINNVWRWTDSGLAGQNDYSGQWNKVMLLFTGKNGIIRLLMHVCGKFFYLIVASCSLLFWGILSECRMIFTKNRTRMSPVHLYILLSLLGTVAIVSIYMINGGRIDCVVYGRYIDFLVGPLILIGLMYLTDRRCSPVYFAAYLCILLFTALGSLKLFHSSSTFTRIMSCGTSIFYNAEVDAFSLKYCVITAALIGLVIFAASYFRKLYLWIMAFIIVIGYWCISADDVLGKEVLPGQSYIRDADVLEQLIESNAAPVYFTTNEHVESFLNRRIENLQFLLKDTTMQYVSHDGLSDIEGDYYLVQYHTDDIDLDKYTIVGQAFGLFVMTPTGSQLEADCRKYNSLNPSVPSDKVMYSATASADRPFTSDHNEGFLVFAQNLTLSPGTYHVNIRLKVSDIDADAISAQGASNLVLCASDISYSRGDRLDLLCTRNYTADMVEAGYLDISYDFTAPETLSCVEIRVYSYGKAFLELEHLSYHDIVSPDN